MAGITDSDVGIPLFMSASGTIKNSQGALLGILCTLTTATATVDLYDTATAGATPSGQPHFVQGLVLPAASPANPFVPIKAAFANGCQFVLGGSGSVGLTFIYK